MGSTACGCSYTLYATRAEATNPRGGYYDTCPLESRSRVDPDKDITAEQAHVMTSRRPKNGNVEKKDESCKQNVDNALQELLQNDGYRHFAENRRNSTENGLKSVENGVKSVENCDAKTGVVKPMTSAVSKNSFSIATSVNVPKIRLPPTESFSKC